MQLFRIFGIYSLLRMIRKEEAKEKKTRDYIHCIKIKQKEKRERDFDWNRIKLYTEDVLDGDIIGGIRVNRCNLGICESWFVSLSLSWSFDWRRNSCADWRTCHDLSTDVEIHVPIEEQISHPYELWVLMDDSHR